MVDGSEQPDTGGDLQRNVDEYIRTAQPPPAEILELEFVYEALAHPRRRYIVYSLLSSARWSLTELATKIAAWERGIPEADVADFERDEMFVSLYHAHVPKLIELDIVEFEGEDGEVIVADDNAVQALAVLEGAGASIDPLQETHARSDHE